MYHVSKRARFTGTLSRYKSMQLAAESRRLIFKWHNFSSIVIHSLILPRWSWEESLISTPDLGIFLPIFKGILLTALLFGRFLWTMLYGRQPEMNTGVTNTSVIYSRCDEVESFLVSPLTNIFSLPKRQSTQMIDDVNHLGSLDVLAYIMMQGTYVWMRTMVC